jgi:hypothetical protein
MNLQQKTINRVRRTYPEATLQEFSSMSGINKSRLFRLFNGSEMKLCEYESLRKIARKPGQEILEQHFEEFKKMIFKLNEAEVKKWIYRMKREIYLSQLNPSIQTTSQESIA